MQKELEIINRLQKEQTLSVEDLQILLTTEREEAIDELAQRARETAQRIYGNKVYIRGLIEFTNYCKKDCYYCGIRRGNSRAERYRLTKEQILSCCETGYELGFRTFVLQGGEDPYFTDERICELVREIKSGYPDCALTLSIGEKSRASYQAYFEAGADRYLLRHETADAEHYKKLHPAELSFESRRRCLMDLKEIGFQTGCGFMVGSPYQTIESLHKDLMFIRELRPQMVGIGPFIPQKDTPFGDKEAGTLEGTLRLLSIIRLLHPLALIPSTTALGTIHPKGREKGILAGANVVMPNLSPTNVREKYKLYDNKICTGDEAAECRFCMQRRMESIGYQVATDRGDYAGLSNGGCKKQ
ncbi:MAG: [FeFe] hydrogenase H-cluster radical SAM maturase HydE [Roseburia sp.]